VFRIDVGGGDLCQGGGGDTVRVLPLPETISAAGDAVVNGVAEVVPDNQEEEGPHAEGGYVPLEEQVAVVEPEVLANVCQPVEQRNVVVSEEDSVPDVSKDGVSSY